MAQRNGIFGAALVVLLACSQADEAGRYSGENGGAGGMGTTGIAGSVGSGGAADAGGEGGIDKPPEVCDELAFCGDYSRGCTSCAVKGLCLGAYEGCFGDNSCVQFNMCMAGCQDDIACQNECATANSLGAERYNALLTCILCESCPSSCAGSASICP